MSAVITAEDYALLLDLQLASANLRLIEELCPNLLRAYKDLPAPPAIHRTLQISRRNNRTASWIRGARGERWGYMAANVLYQIERSLRPTAPTATPLTARDLVLIWRPYHVTHGEDYPVCAQRIFALWEALATGEVNERICRCGRSFIADANDAPQACPWCTEGVTLRPRSAATKSVAANDNVVGMPPIDIDISASR